MAIAGRVGIAKWIAGIGLLVRPVGGLDTPGGVTLVGGLDALGGVMLVGVDRVLASVV